MQSIVLLSTHKHQQMDSIIMFTIKMTLYQYGCIPVVMVLHHVHCIMQFLLQTNRYKSIHKIYTERSVLHHYLPCTEVLCNKKARVLYMW